MALIKKISYNTFFWFCAWALWMGIIFYFSDQPGSHWPPDTSWSYFLERKGAHVFEYSVLFLLSLQFFSLLYSKESLKNITLLSIVWSIMYAVSDELHQFFTPYRGAHFRDVAFDILGIGVGLLIVFCIQRFQRKKTLQ